MTHKDIYTKFMIEYDKANVTSSYPSLTEYEVATLLDKAYQALIAQKFTGNNTRRVPFEYDEKAIADLAPLVVHAHPALIQGSDRPATNIMQYTLPEDMMYYVASSLNQTVTTEPMDGQNTRLVPTKLVTHGIAEKFFNTPYNMPWVKVPVSFIEGNTAYVVYDPINKPDTTGTIHLSYIKKPKSFVKSLKDVDGGGQGGGGHDTPDTPDQPDTPVEEQHIFILDVSQLDGEDKIQ